MTTVHSTFLLPPINPKVNLIVPSRFSLLVSVNRNVHPDPVTPSTPLFSGLLFPRSSWCICSEECICTGRFGGSDGDGHFAHLRRDCVASTRRTRLRIAFGVAMDPQEDQDMEIEALQAIYLPHEFGRAESHPWSAPSEGSVDEGKQACGDAWTVRVGDVRRSERKRKERRNGC